MLISFGSGVHLRPPAEARSTTGSLLQASDVIYTADEAAEANQGITTELGGARFLIAVPMLKEDELVGTIVLYRQEVRPFTDKQIELVQTSPRKPSSPSRTRGCSTTCANRSISKPRLPRC